MYITSVMFVQRFEPRGRRFTNFHYYYYYCYQCYFLLIRSNVIDDFQPEQQVWLQTLRQFRTRISFGQNPPGDTQIEIWLDLFNAELSPKRYWRGPGSQEVGEEGDYT